MVPEVEQVVLTALAKDPQQRFASVQAFAKALEQVSRASSHTPLSLNEAVQPINAHPVLSQSAILTELVTPPSQSSLPTETVTGERPQQASPLEVVLSSEPALPTNGGADISPSQQPPSINVRAPLSQSSLSAETATPSSQSVQSTGGSMPIHPSEVSSLLTREPILSRGIQLPKRRPSRRMVLAGLVGLAVVGSGGLAWLAISHQQLVSTASVSPAATSSPIPSPTPSGPPLGTTFYTYRGHSSSTTHGFHPGVTGVTWSPDNKRIASAGIDQTVQVWDATNGGNAFTYRGHTDAVNAITWSPDGKHIASASADNTVQIWDATNGGNAFTYHGHTGSVLTIAWSLDSKRIASGGFDITVQVWQAS